jgi:hypothetical protein
MRYDFKVWGDTADDIRRAAHRQACKFFGVKYVEDGPIEDFVLDIDAQAIQTAAGETRVVEARVTAHTMPLI